MQRYLGHSSDLRLERVTCKDTPGSRAGLRVCLGCTHLPGPPNTQRLTCKPSHTATPEKSASCTPATCVSSKCLNPSRNSTLSPNDHTDAPQCTAGQTTGKPGPASLPRHHFKFRRKTYRILTLTFPFPSQQNRVGANDLLPTRREAALHQ